MSKIVVFIEKYEVKKRILENLVKRLNIETEESAIKHHILLLKEVIDDFEKLQYKAYMDLRMAYKKETSNDRPDFFDGDFITSELIEYIEWLEGKLLR